MHLNDPTLLRKKVPVAGRWIGCESRETTTTRNPATGGIVGQVPELGAAETQEAIAAAVTAQRAWAHRTAGERANTLKEWFGLVIENRDDLGMILTLQRFLVK